MKLREIAARVGGTVTGDGEVEIVRLNAIEAAGPGELTFLANPKYAAALKTTAAAAVIAREAPAEYPRTFLIHPDPYFAFAQALRLFYPAAGSSLSPGVAATAAVHPTAVLGEGVHIGEHAVIGAESSIGAGAKIMSGAVIGSKCKIGNDSLIFPNVTIYDGCLIGERVAIHAGTVIGSDGFGYATNAGTHFKVLQVGNVRIEDDVEIGANCTIDRGAIGDTVIGQGCKIDNLCQIAHNVKLGKGCIIVAQVGIAGSTVFGDYVVAGGQVGFVGHINIGSGARFIAQSGVSKSLKGGMDYGGSPAREAREYREIEALIRRLPQKMQQLKKLAADIEEIWKRLDRIDPGSA
jgi:UDP-3-O-[3-hydroxymyristoyl] glucosamine N-acyltransferase